MPELRSNLTCSITHQASADSVPPSFVVFLPIPDHDFHGNHWFHVGEYFLSRMSTVHTWIDRAISTSKESEEANSLKSYILYLVSPNMLLHRMLTHVTFYFLILMAWNPLIKHIKLVSPHRWSPTMENLKIDSSTRFCGTITHSFTYDSQFDNSWQQLQNNERIDELVSGTYIGSLDNFPVPTTQWFRQDLSTLRKHIKLLCPKRSRNTDLQLSSVDKRQVLVYQRDQIRRILNAEDIFFPNQFSLTTVVGSPDVVESPSIMASESSEELMTIHHDDNRGFCDLFHLLNPDGDFTELKKNRRLFISTHGFQLAALFLMAPGTTVLEIFPYRYFKPSYFPLYGVLNITHVYFQSQYRDSLVGRYLDNIPQEVCLMDKACRSFARNQDLRLLPSEINLIRHMLFSPNDDNDLD